MEFRETMVSFFYSKLPSFETPILVEFWRVSRNQSLYETGVCMHTNSGFTKLQFHLSFAKPHCQTRPESFELPPMAINEKKKKQVHSLLQSKAPSDIMRLLLIDAAALKAHCGAHSPGSSDALRLAVDARAQTRGWTILACPRCDATFFDSQSLSDHVVGHHLRPNKELQPLMPRKADRNRVDALLRPSNNWDRESIVRNQESRKLLEATRSALQKLAENDVLADSQLAILFKIAVGDSADDRISTLCFQSSKAPQLRMVVTLLEGLISECCGGVEAGSSSCGNNGCEEIEAEKILVGDDGSKLVLNASQFLKRSCLPDADALVSWLYDDDVDDDEKDLSDWNELKKEKKNRGNEIYEKLKGEFEELEMICVKKHSCVGYRSAVAILEKVFVDLVARTEQSGEAVMRKIRGDLSERTGKDTHVLRHVAASVCKEAESLKASKMRNLVKLVKQEDNSTVEAFRKQLWDSDFEEIKCDARLLRKSLDIGRLEAELVRASALDYLAVVVPLVKSFLRRHLEDEARLGVAAA